VFVGSDLSRGLASLPEGTQVIVEATGGYDRLLVEQCWKQSKPVSVINPRQARDVAKATGKLGNISDRFD